MASLLTDLFYGCKNELFVDVNRGFEELNSDCTYIRGISLGWYLFKR